MQVGSLGSSNPYPATSVRPSASTGSVDLSNATSSQMVGEMNSLISNGKMTFDQSSAIVGLARTPLTQVPGTQTQSTGPYNVLGELQAGIAGSKSRGDTAAANSETNVLDILEAASTDNSINISV